MMHDRRGREVSMWRRAGGVVPFQRRRFPRVVRSLFAPDPRANEVDREENLADAQREGADRDELVHRLEVRERAVIKIGRDSPRKAADAQDVHREEHAVEEDEC